MWQPGGEWGRMDPCVCMAESLCCSPETITALLIGCESVTSWTVAHQAPLSVEFSRLEYWSVLPFPSPEDPPDPGIEPGFPSLWADSFPSEPQGSCSPETITTLLTGCNPMQNKKLLKNKIR